MISQKRFLFIVIVALLIAYLGWLGFLGLRAEEPRRAVVSIEMMMNGDYVMPHLLGWPYYNKPPLFNWVMIPFFKLFGSYHEWVVRLPSTLALLVLAFLNWKIIRRHVMPEVAILSSLFILTSTDILFYGSVNTGEIDLFFSLIVYLEIIVIYVFLQKKQFLWLFILSYCLAALGFLTKGLPSIAFQALTLVAGLAYFRSLKLLFSWKHIVGIVLFLLLSGGYMLLLDNRGELAGFLIRQFKESTQRTGLESDFFGTLKGLVENPAVLIKITLPWSLSLFALFNKAIRRKILSNRLVAYSLLVVAVNFPIYWITGELRGRYLYPIVPFLCIACAMIVYEGYPKLKSFRFAIDRAVLILFLIFPAVLIAAYFIPDFHMDTANKIIHGLLVISSMALALFFIRNKSLRIMAVVLLLVVAKISMNTTYLPTYKATSQTTTLKNHVEKMLAIAGDRKIQVTGTPYIFHSSVNILGWELMQDEVVVSIIMSYQVPYYYALYTDRVLSMTTEPTSGNLYLIAENDRFKFPGDVLYSYTDISTQNNWYLVRLSSE